MTLSVCCYPKILLNWEGENPGNEVVIDPDHGFQVQLMSSNFLSAEERLLFYTDRIWFVINKSPPCFLYIDIGLMIFQFIVTAYEVRANYPQAGVFFNISWAAFSWRFVSCIIYKVIIMLSLEVSLVPGVWLWIAFLGSLFWWTTGSSFKSKGLVRNSRGQQARTYLHFGHLRC